MDKRAFRAVTELAAIVIVLGLLPPAQAAGVPKCFGQKATKVGTSRSEKLIGTKGRDVIVGRGGDDLIAGLKGNDLICAGGGLDILLFVGAKTGVTVDLANGISTGQGQDRLKSLEFVLGTGFDDVLIGDDQTNIFLGDEGNDRLVGGDGIDFLSGDGGDDRIEGGLGSDYAAYFGSPTPIQADLAAGTVTGQGNDTLAEIESIAGSELNDSLLGDAGDNFFLPGGDDDLIDGREGLDTVAFWFAVAAIDANLQAGRALGEGTDDLRNLEGLFGSEDFGDTLTGNQDNNYLDGDAGNDVIDGGPGLDWLVGGPGDDTLEGGPGDYDIADFYGTTGIVANLDTGTSVGDGNDTLAGFEALYGTQYNDILTGNGGVNYLFGWFGSDQINGLAGDDFIDGQDGNDSADGGEGNDNCLGLEGTILSCEGVLEAPLHPLAAYSADASAVRSLRPPRQ